MAHDGWQPSTWAFTFGCLIVHGISLGADPFSPADARRYPPQAGLPSSRASQDFGLQAGYRLADVRSGSSATDRSFNRPENAPQDPAIATSPRPPLTWDTAAPNQPTPNRYRGPATVAASTSPLPRGLNRRLPPLRSHRLPTPEFQRLPPVATASAREQGIGRGSIVPVQQRATLPPAVNNPANELELPPTITNEILKTVQEAGHSRVFDKIPAIAVPLKELIARTLATSNRVKILKIQPLEIRQSVEREYGRFDWRAFVENRFLHGEIPVQDSVEVQGQQAAIRQEELEIRWGVRKQTTFGSRLEVRDSFGLRDDNSGILTPPDQGVAGLSLSFQQEFLRNAGRDINLSPALIANYQADGAHANSVAEISTQIERVVDLYWTLFERRGNYFVRRALVFKARDVLEQLEERKDVDAQENMIAQARALILEAEAQVVQAKVEILLAQDGLRRAVNDPYLEQTELEIIPTEVPFVAVTPLDVSAEIPVAIRNRGEIHRSLAGIRLAATRHHVSMNQLLPRLTLILEASANGLDAREDIGGARSNAFDHGPLVEANVNLEFFLGNRRARAASRQAELAITRRKIEFEDAIEAVKLDVRQSVSRLNGLTGILDLRFRTLNERARELDFLRYRYSVIPQEGANRSLLLEQYFLALNRMVASELEYFRSLTDQQQALIDLQRAKGLLVRSTYVATDIDAPVPGVSQAYRHQQERKPHYINETERAVVAPNLVPR